MKLLTKNNFFKLGIVVVILLLLSVTTIFLTKKENNNSYGVGGNSLSPTSDYPVGFENNGQDIKKTSVGEINSWQAYDYSDGSYKPYYSEKVLDNTSLVYVNKNTNQRIEFWKNLSVPNEYLKAIIQTIDSKDSKYFNGKVYRVTSSQITDKWGSFSIATFDDSVISNGEALNSESTAVTIYPQDNNLVGTFNCKGDYLKIMKKAPQSFMDNESKNHLEEFCTNYLNKL